MTLGTLKFQNKTSSLFKKCKYFYNIKATVDMIGGSTALHRNMSNNNWINQDANDIEIHIMNIALHIVSLPSNNHNHIIYYHQNTTSGEFILI